MNTIFLTYRSFFLSSHRLIWVNDFTTIQQLRVKLRILDDGDFEHNYRTFFFFRHIQSSSSSFFLHPTTQISANFSTLDNRRWPTDRPRSLSSLHRWQSLMIIVGQRASVRVCLVFFAFVCEHSWPIYSTSYFLVLSRSLYTLLIGTIALFPFYYILHAYNVYSFSM